MPFFLLLPVWAMPHRAKTQQQEVFQMVLNWFDAREAKAFGKELALFYGSRASTTSEVRKKTIVEKKQRELLSKVLIKINVFKNEHDLNVYKKAQFGNSFKWQLIESGFEKKYADEITDWVLHHV